MTDAAPPPDGPGNILDLISVKKKREKPKTNHARANTHPSGDWRNNLIVKMTDGGAEVILCRVHNIVQILENAPEFAGRIKFNQFSEQPNIDGQDLDDTTGTAIMAALEKGWINEKVNPGYVNMAIALVAKQNPFHPVLDWLNSLVWDGTPRIEHLFSDHFGAPFDAYHSAAAKSLFISAVLRVINPGCKCDTMTVLEGVQGGGKTEIWVVLFSPWYAEVIDSLSGKDFFSGQRGIWCADFGELDQFAKTEVTRIKQVLTMREDNYRNHYGRNHTKHPRQLIFVGGTNRHDWQTDPTGGRRFLPVQVSTPIDTNAIAAAREQLFAEAMVLAKDPGAWWEIPGAQEHQDESYVGDSWEEVIGAWVTGRASATIAQVLEQALRIEPGKQTRADQTRAGNALRRIGWTAKKETVSGARVAVYRRGQGASA